MQKVEKKQELCTGYGINDLIKAVGTTVKSDCEAYCKRLGFLFKAVANMQQVCGKSKFDDYDVYVLGKQLEIYKKYEESVIKDSAQVRQLSGFAKDVITGVYAISPVSHIANRQTLSGTQGAVYYKKLQIKESNDTNKHTAQALPNLERVISTKDVTTEVVPIDIDFNKYFQDISQEEADKLILELIYAIANVDAQRTVQCCVNMANHHKFDGKATLFDLHIPDGVSFAEHRASFVDALASADRDIFISGAISAANCYLVGHEAGELFRKLRGFKFVYATLGLSTHLLGYYDGKPVIRTFHITNLCAPKNSVLQKQGDIIDPKNAIIALYNNSEEPFDAPLIEATHLPLLVTEDDKLATQKGYVEINPHYVKPIFLYNSKA